MFTIFKTFSWAALVSALGYAFVDSPEMLLPLISPNNYQAQINNYKATYEEMNSRDQIIVQRLHIKNQVFNAFKQQEISIYQAASCFQTLILYSNDKYETIPITSFLDLSIFALFITLKSAHRICKQTVCCILRSFS